MSIIVTPGALASRVRNTSTAFAAGWPGQARSALLTGLLTAVSTLSYASVIGAAFDGGLLTAALMSGFIGAVLGGAVASLCSPMPSQIFAPRASVCVVIASAASAFGAQHAGLADALPRTLASVAACLLAAALIQGAFAVFRLGGLIRLIPHSVTTGLTIAIAIGLVWTQAPDLVGGRDASAIARLWPLATACITFAAMLWARQRGLGGYATLVGLVAGAAAAALLHLLLPQDTLPRINVQPHLQALDAGRAPLLAPWQLFEGWQPFEGWRGLLSPAASTNLLAFALVIAVLNATETLTSAMALEEVMSNRIDANRALMAGALGSLAAVLAGGLPVAGSAATSVSHLRSGGRSRGSALLAALVVAAVVLGCGRWFVHIPLAVVASIMTMVAFGLVAAPFDELRRHWGRRHDEPHRIYGELAVCASVAVLMLATDLLIAIGGGLALATALALSNMRAGLVRRRYDANDLSVPEVARARIATAISGTIHVIELGQPVFFATVESVLRLIDRAAARRRFIVLDMRHVGAPDATAARSLARCCASRANDQARIVMVCAPESAGAAGTSALPGCIVFDDLTTALRDCANCVACDDDDALTIVRPRGLSTSMPGPSSDMARPGALRPPLQAPAVAGSASPSAALRPAGSPAPARHVALTEDLAKRAERELTRILGPIASVIARRARANAPDAQGFLQLLASHLEEPAARAAFLASAHDFKGDMP